MPPPLSLHYHRLPHSGDGSPQQTGPPALTSISSFNSSTNMYSSCTTRLAMAITESIRGNGA